MNDVHDSHVNASFDVRFSFDFCVAFKNLLSKSHTHTHIYNNQGVVSRDLFSLHTQTGTSEMFFRSFRMNIL